MSILSYALLLGTTVVLIATTAWRLRRPVDAALLIPIAWLALMPIQVAIFGPLRGYSGAPRDSLYISIALGNLTFVGLQFFLGSDYFKRLSAAVRSRLAPRTDLSAAGWQRLANVWWYAIAAVAVALAVVHLWLMPKVPLFEVLSGSTDFYRLAGDRENAAKLLAVPSIVKYVFAWNGSMFLPILFYAAIMYRWRYRAIFIGVFGLIYIMAPLDKLPAVLFVLGAFVAIAVRDGKRPFSKILIAGVVVSLIPAYLVTDLGPISIAIHHAVGAPVTQTTPPPDLSGVPPPGEVPVTSIFGVKLPKAVANILDITLRRIASGPTDVAYQWFSFFPAVHPFLNGAGWEPWKVLSSGYQNPANMVGLWAYYGKAGYGLNSISAYTGFLGDGWAEFGYAGVLIACLWLFAFCIVIELMRTFSDNRFCLACYVPCLLLLAATAPISGIMAMTFSLGIVLGPVICLAYLLSSRMPLPAAGRLAPRPESTLTASE